MDERLKRSRLSLEGLSAADALGGFFEFTKKSHFVTNRTLPDGVWHYTDDTNMALSIYTVLQQHGEIKQDALAADFAARFDPARGYGAGARRLMKRMRAGEHWRDVSREMFSGQGSWGNGGAMRVAPLGAFFADDLTACVKNAALSAEITHAHPEGIAGAIAVAVAAAIASQLMERPSRAEFLELILPHVPDSEVKSGIRRAQAILPQTDTRNAADMLGNGSKVSAMDTVPFALWCAGNWLDNYEEAFWQTASAGGDVDTTCAIVGGIVACFDREGIPAAWISHREKLPI